MLPTAGVTPATPESCVGNHHLHAALYGPSKCVEGKPKRLPAGHNSLLLGEIRGILRADLARIGVGCCIAAVKPVLCTRGRTIGTLQNMNWMPKLRPLRGLLLLCLSFALCQASRANSRLQNAASAATQEQTPAHADPATKSDDKDSQPLTLSDQVIQQVLEPLRAGMETQDVSQVLSVFDRQEMSSYGDLQGQLRAFFHMYDEVHFRYQLLQATADGDHGSATAEIDMDALPYEPTQTPARRSVQMRFQLKQSPKGWKIVGFTPADFFSVGLNPSKLEQE
jgi:hypothetical protein